MINKSTVFELESSIANQDGRRKIFLSVDERMTILIGGDIFLLFISVIVALWGWQIYSGNSLGVEFILANSNAFFIIIPWLLISVITDSYGYHTIDNLLRSIKQPARTAVIAWVVYAFLFFFAPVGALPRFWILIFGSTSCLALIGWRYLHYHIFTHEQMRQKIAILSDGNEDALIEELLTNSYYYELVALISVPSDDDNQKQQNCLSEIDKLCYRIDKLVLSMQQPPSIEYLQKIIQSREAGISIVPLPLFYEQLYRRIPIRNLQSWNILHLPLQEAERGFYPIGKRLLDLVCAFLGLVLFAVLFPFLALAIKIDSPGPLFFSQIRVGKRNRKFRLWKLRTMIIDAEKKGPMWTQKNDQRITRFGRIIRKLHLDELPQSWNILIGEMSVVGVRPLSVSQCEKFSQTIPIHNLRHLVTPGVTSWAIVNYRHVNDVQSAHIRLEYDLYYVKHQTIWLDLYIIFRTIWTMVTMNGL